MGSCSHGDRVGLDNWETDPVRHGTYRPDSTTHANPSIPTPVWVDSVDNVSAIAGGEHVSAAVACGRAFMWGGHNGYHRILNECFVYYVTIPCELHAPAHPPAAIAMRRLHQASVFDGKLLTGGGNGFGQCGHGISSTNRRMERVNFTGAALTVQPVDGKRFTWGQNKHGQMRDGSNTTRTHPDAVCFPGTSGIVSAIALGGYHSSAITDGKLFTWGSNRFGHHPPSTIAGNTPVLVTLSGTPSVVLAVALGM